MDILLEQEIREIIRDEIIKAAISSLNTPHHTHTLTDAGQLDASQSLVNSPQDKLTTADADAFVADTTGTFLTDANVAILDNMRTRLDELETKLTTIGLLKET